MGSGRSSSDPLEVATGGATANDGTPAGSDCWIAAGTVPRGNGEDVNRAVAAASKALPAWSKVAPRDRGKILLKNADALEAEIENLARIIAQETGNAIRT